MAEATEVKKGLSSEHKRMLKWVIYVLALYGAVLFMKKVVFRV